MGYPTHVAAALSGASVRQLQYWRQRRNGTPPLLVPETRLGSRVLYSFRDVIALRTFVYLHEDLSLQRIRKAVSRLREFGSTEHLSTRRLFVANRSVVWAESEDRLVDLVKNAGQFQLKATMRDVLAPFTNLRGEQIVDLLRPRERLQVDPETRGGYPVVLHTRIPYDLVGELVVDGVPPHEVGYFYPAVSAAAATDAFDFHVYAESLRGHLVAAAAG